jgi:predicted RND superfamily exporter protein
LSFVATRGLHIDASFTKQLPLQHEYMQTFVKHQAEFGGANRVLIALVARDGNMFTPGFFDALKKATDEVLVMDGIDRTRVQSLFTPNVRYMEVVEGGIEAGNVGRLGVRADPRSAGKGPREHPEGRHSRPIGGQRFLGRAGLGDRPRERRHGKPIDPIQVARDLESRVRDKIQGTDVLVQAQGSGVDVHMIGFAKVVGDIADGAMSVIVFAVVTILLTLLAVWYYVQSLKVAVVPIVCSLVAVAWQLGTLVLLGYGIDPLGLLVPFLIFAIGVSHGVQKISAVKEAAVAGVDSMRAARQTFRQLLMPAIIALLADLVGFVTILLIPVQVVQEMAVTASIGVAIVILTDLILLPVLVSWVHWDDHYRARVEVRQAKLTAHWSRLARITERKPAAIIIGIAVLLGIFGVWKGRETPIGDTQAGVPELRADSRYNRDSNIITTKFSIGVDVLTVIVETKEPACTNTSS